MFGGPDDFDGADFNFADPELENWFADRDELVSGASQPSPPRRRRVLAAGGGVGGGGGGLDGSEEVEEEEEPLPAAAVFVEVPSLLELSTSFVARHLHAIAATSVNLLPYELKEAIWTTAQRQALNDDAMSCLEPMLGRPYLAQLSEFDLSLSAVSAEGVAHLCRHCPTLTAVNASSCSRFDDQACAVLADGCRGLQRLDLQGCTEVTDKGVSALGRLGTSLRHLNLELAREVTDFGMQVRPRSSSLFALNN